VIAVVHDEIQGECEPGDVDEVKRTLEQTASEMGEQLGFLVPIAAEAKAGASWEETH
jgi:DNA polymerase I-like protein with 3'-5' exonuclease and polymerase domains